MIVHPIFHSRHEVLPEAMPIRVMILQWIISTFLDPTQQKTVVDLGCGGMALTKLYRDQGFDVTAVDVRTDRNRDKEKDGIKFIQQDIRETDLNGYDVISHLGLLYHMTLEDQLDMFNRIPSNTITVLETQIYEPNTVTPKGAKRLTTAKQDVYHGALWQEPGNHVLTASWNNETSFWHRPNSLYRMCRRTGFKMVIPVEPHFMSMYASRGFYILFK